MSFPENPIAAVTHPDPYRYYADLVAQRPIYSDETLDPWVASGSDTITAVLSSELCRVRPAAEPVPKALLGSPAGELFRHLVRMNDGRGHCPFKQAVSAALEAVDADRAAAQSRAWARSLTEATAPASDPSRLTAFAFDLSVHVVASLLGRRGKRCRGSPSG